MVQRCGAIGPETCPCSNDCAEIPDLNSPTRARGDFEPHSPKGSPLRVGEDLEKRLGSSFASVRIHADAEAGHQALTLGARAFTQDENIYFAPGYFEPETPQGRGLLAHELTHVIQQRQGRFSGGTAASTHPAATRSRLEEEADRIEGEVAASYDGPVRVREATSHGSINRSPLDLVRELSRSGLEGAAAWVVRNSRGEMLIAEIDQLRHDLAGAGGHLHLPVQVATRLEALYNNLRGLAPGWLPLPSISFAGPAVQLAGPAVAIPVAVVILFLLFLILMWWILTNMIPSIRQQREQSGREAIHWIREALARRGTPPVPADAPPRTDTRSESEVDEEPQPENEPRLRPRPRPLPILTPCCCCPQSVRIVNVTTVDDDHWGHNFQVAISLRYTGSGMPRPCRLEWGEHTAYSYHPRMRENTWTDMYDLTPSNFRDWEARRNPCPALRPVSDVVTERDTPALAKTDTNRQRRLHFRVRVHGGEGCPCVPPVVEVTANQFLALASGRWPALESFEVPDPLPPP
jgi:hypothetical protein